MGRKGTRKACADPISPSFTTSLAFGACNVSIPQSLSYEHSGDSLKIDIPHKGPVTITCTTASGTGLRTWLSEITDKHGIVNQNTHGQSVPEGLSKQLLNPKSLDNEGHLLLKAVLNLYTMELPEMSFAANTGKESPFLEKCVTSGKYCTLLLRRRVQNQVEVLAAVSYQILPPDTQYAEIPLTAVSKDYQHQGVGSFLFNELQRRLLDVGVLTIFCWGDEESKGFWLKQGFIKVAEVDGHGKPRKLPIKPEIRRAMSIPGSATLLVLHMYNKPVINASIDKGIVTPPRHVQPHAVEGLHEAAPPVLKPSPAAPITTPVVGEFKTSLQATTPLPAPDKHLVKSLSMMPINIDGAFSSVAASQNESRRSVTPSKCPVNALTPTDQSLSLTFFHQSPSEVTPELVMPNQEGNTGVLGVQVNASPGLNKENVPARSYQRARKRGRSATSLVSGLEKQRRAQDDNEAHGKGCSQTLASQLNKVLMELPESNAGKELSITPKATETYAKHGDTWEDLGHVPNISQRSCPSIMFMNMADEKRRMQLTKVVERLGGSVTTDGCQCTHVVTGEARRTLNFCTALNAGAWVVSSAWLKASVKEKRFIEEEPFILKDAEFENKYKTTVEEVIKKRRQLPHGLLQGMAIYPTPHVQPPVGTLSAIVLSAGGKVLASLEEATDCLDAIVVACEDDISEALVAAKAGLPTYSSEWLMSCIMRQELDVTTVQFAESL